MVYQPLMNSRALKQGNANIINKYTWQWYCVFTFRESASPEYMFKRFYSWRRYLAKKEHLVVGYYAVASTWIPLKKKNQLNNPTVIMKRRPHLNILLLGSKWNTSRGGTLQNVSKELWLDRWVKWHYGEPIEEEVQNIEEREREFRYLRKRQYIKEVQNIDAVCNYVAGHMLQHDAEDDMSNRRFLNKHKISSPGPYTQARLTEVLSCR